MTVLERQQRRAANQQQVQQDRARMLGATTTAEKERIGQEISARTVPQQSAAGLEVERRAQRPSDPAHFGGVPLEEMSAALREQQAKDAEELRRQAAPLETLDQARKAIEVLNTSGVKGLGQERFDRGWEKVKNYIAANPDTIQQIQNEKMQHDLILTDAVPTGAPQIDDPVLFARARAPRGFDPKKNRIVTEAEILEEAQNFQFDPTSREGIIKNSAEQGVDYRRGFRFNDLFKKATNIDTPSVQAQVQSEILADLTKNIPEGLPAIRVNGDTGQVEYMRQVTDDDVDAGYESADNVDKFRWTSIDPASFNAQQLGKLFDVSEVGSILGGVGGSIATRNLTFFKTAAGTAGGIGRGLKGLTGETFFGLAGREAGNMIKLGVSAFQGRDIDPAEAMQLFESDVGKEAAAAFLGRGSSKVLEKMKKASQAAEARFNNREIVPGSIDSVAERNKARMQTARDSQEMNRKLKEAGRQERLAPTPAEAETRVNDQLQLSEGPSGQTQRLQEEAARRRNIASPSKAFATTLRSQEQRSALRSVAEGMEQATKAVDPSAVSAANRAGTTLRVSAVEGDPTRGRIHPAGLAEEAGQRRGLVFQTDSDTMRVVSSGLPEELRGIGLGSDMYKGFLNLAQKEGRTGMSGSSITPDADAVWRRMGDEGYQVVRSPKAKPVLNASGKVEGFSTGNPLEPVWQVKAPSTQLSKNIIETGKRYRLKDDGTYQPNPNFDSFMRAPNSKVLAAVSKQIGSNRSAKAEMVDAIWKHHDSQVLRKENGKLVYSDAAKRKWLKDTETTLNKVFSPEELEAIARDPSFLKKHATSMMESKNNLETQMGAILKTADPKVLVADPGKMLKRLNGAPVRERQRALRVLESMNPEAYTAFKGALSSEIKEAAHRTVNTANVTRAGQHKFGKWLTDNKAVIEEVMGKEYQKGLERFNRSIARQASTQGIVAPKTPINTTIMMTSRTIFGALSNWQRRMTAARRVQVENWYARVLDVISDPQKLKQLESIDAVERRLEPGTRALVEATVRLGLVDSEEEYDEWKQFALEMGTRGQGVEQQ